MPALHLGRAQSLLQHCHSLFSEVSVVQIREHCWCCVVPGKQQVFMLRVMLIIPVPGNAAWPCVCTWGRRCCSCRFGICPGCCAGSSQWGPQAERARAGSRSGALTGWSVWVGRVSLGAAGDSALPWLSGHVITPMSLRWLHAVPPTQNREEVGTGTGSVSCAFPSREAAVLGRRGSLHCLLRAVRQQVMRGLCLSLSL